MAKRRRRYDDDFRASAVVMLEAQGYPEKVGALSAVARHLGVQPRTLSRWYNKEQNPPPDQLVKHKKGVLLNELDALIEKFVERMYDEADDAPLRELATAFGIAFDKKQLLEGKPTERSEQSVTHDVGDSARAIIERNLSRIAASRTTDGGVSGSDD